MNTKSLITCDCGTDNLPSALQCRQCGHVFDGSAGHTFVGSRHVTQSVMASRRFPNDLTGNQGIGTLPAMSSKQVSRSLPVLAEERDIQIAILTFADGANIAVPPSAPRTIRSFTLHPCGSTNEAAGFSLAGKVWKDQLPDSRLDVILFGDGEPTSGGGSFGDDAEAAIKEANRLKGLGARIGAIGFDGGSYNPNHLRALVSSPALLWKASSGNVTPAFLAASHTMTQCGRQHGLSEFVVFLIDSSGSMDEGNKKTEVEAAVKASIELLG